jgi:DNA gyrase/topoisomerase IV subunit B
MSEAASYSAKDIEVLEGLEPVRRRPGMYIGGTDENALHHLAAEILDNAMDEAVAGHADRIEVTLEPGNFLTVRDNGRGFSDDEADHRRSEGHVGLSLLHERAAEVDGRLTVDSTPGRGTVVRLEVPV